MIRIFIVDDHAVVRRGLRQIVEETEDMLVVGEASDADSAIDSMDRTEFDVLLLDISMPGRNGFDVLAQVHRTKPKLPVLVLSIHSEEQYGVRALRSGAAGYLTKDSAPDDLVEAIRKVSAGGKYITSALAEKVLRDVELMENRPAHEHLSNREYQVLTMIASGKTVKQIADELHLSEKTISTYRVRLLEKMNLTTNAQLTYYAVSNHLID